MGLAGAADTTVKTTRPRATKKGRRTQSNLVFRRNKYKDRGEVEQSAEKLVK